MLVEVSGPDGAMPSAGKVLGDETWFFFQSFIYSDGRCSEAFIHNGSWDLAWYHGISTSKFTWNVLVDGWSMVRWWTIPDSTHSPSSLWRSVVIQDTSDWIIILNPCNWSKTNNYTMMCFSCWLQFIDVNKWWRHIKYDHTRLEY